MTLLACVCSSLQAPLAPTRSAFPLRCPPLRSSTPWACVSDVGQHSLSETVLDNPGGGHKGHMCPGLPRHAGPASTLRCCVQSPGRGSSRGTTRGTDGSGGGAEGAGGTWTAPAPSVAPLWSMQPHFTPTFGTPCAVSPIDPPYGAVGPALARRRCGGARGDSESGVRIALALLDREIQHLLEYRSQQDESEAHTPIPCGPREARGTQKILSLHLSMLAS